VVAIHVLNILSTRQRRGDSTTLQHLIARLPVRRADLRRVVSALHREGYLDATRMRLTLQGFAVGASIDANDMPALRETAVAPRRAA
jgi:DNA-binding IclR family transcriptional regulator